MDVQLFEYHPVIGYKFIPGIKARIDHEGGGYLLRTNSAGFRCEHEFKKEKTPGKFRILLFGDSFTAGDGVSNKHRFGDVLETLIPGVEVYNFGLPGSGTDQHYLIWQEIAREIEHDLVIIAVQVENIRRVAARHRLTVNGQGEEVLMAKPYYELDRKQDGSELVLKGIPVSKEPIKPEDIADEDKEFVDQGGRMPWLRNIVNKLGVKDIAQKLSGYQPLPEYDDPNSREWQTMSALLSQWWGALEGRHTIVMPIPLYQYVEESASPENYRKRFTEFAESVESIELTNIIHSTNSTNFELHDPMPDYYAVPKAERRGFRFEKDIHPTPAHHKLLAESLAKTVVKFIPAKAEASAK